MGNFLVEPDMDFKILSDGKMMMIVFGDDVIVFDSHYLTEIITHVTKNMIDVSTFGIRDCTRLIHRPLSTELDLKIMVAGEITYCHGKDILKEFDLFKNFKVMDLLKAVKAKLNVREEKLKGEKNHNSSSRKRQR
jgi:hypothetical protein